MYVQYASFGAVSPSIILGTKRKNGLLSQKSKKGTPNNNHAHFDHEENHDHHDLKDHSAPHVRSFVYKSQSPFHPQRLVGLLRNLRQQSKANVGRGVLRSKGLIWLATDMEKSRCSYSSSPMFGTKTISMLLFYYSSKRISYTINLLYIVGV